VGQAAVSKIFEALKKAELTRRSRPRVIATREESAQIVFRDHTTDFLDPHETESRANAGLTRLSTSSQILICFFLGAFLTSAAFIVPRHYAPSVGDNGQAVKITSAGKTPAVLAQISPVDQSISTLPAALSPDSSGFVVQVAAMRHEENADALAALLHDRNFPAFVVKRGAFYYVAVGVYGDADSAVKVRDELQKQGFEVILRRWLP